MSYRSDLLWAGIMGGRWNATSAPADGITVVASVSAPSNYDSKHHLESLTYSIANLTAIQATVQVQVRSSSQAGSVLASVDHLVPAGQSVNVNLPSMKFVGKIGMGLAFTMSTTVASLSQKIDVAGWTEDVSSTSFFDSSYIKSLSPVAWFRYGVGITGSPSVSQWDDQSGNGNHLKQAGATAQPQVQADNSILFDGTAQFLKCDAFTLNQPETVYLLMKQITWASDKYFANGTGNTTGGFQQITASPQFRQIAGGATGLTNKDLALDTWAVIGGVFNGSASVSQVNNNAAVSIDIGVGNMGGFTLADRGSGTNCANIQVKEVIIFPAAHDSATRSRVISYLKTVGQLSF